MAQPTTGVVFSASFPPADDGNQLALPRSNGGQPAQFVTFQPQAATASLLGVVKPDGTTTTVDADGTIHAVGGTGSGGTSASGGSYICVVPSGAKDGSNTQYTIPAPVLAGTAYFYVRNGVMQRQLGTSAEFSVQGTTITTKTPLQGGVAPDWHEFYYIMGQPNSESGGGGGVTPVGSPVLRGSAITNADSASSLTLALPAGTQAGDLAIFFLNTAWTPNGPSGWTTVYLDSSSTNNMLVASKILTSGDISTGSVTGTQTKPPFGPQADVCALAIVTFIGPAGGVREAEGSFNSGSPFTITNTTTGAVINTDVAIYYASARGASVPIPTITPASGAATTLRTFADTVMTGRLADQAMPGGALAVANTGTSGGGSAAVQVIVKGS